MSMAENRGQITKGFRELTTRWEHVKSSWNDAQAANFQKMYIMEFENLIRKAAGTMDHMNIVLQKVTKDCE